VYFRTNVVGTLLTTDYERFEALVGGGEAVGGKGEVLPT